MKTKVVQYHYEMLLKSSTTVEKEKIAQFFSELNKAIEMNENEKNEMINDYIQAFMWYRGQEYTLERTLKLLHPKSLNDFYSKKHKSWWTLDDAAKIYPLSTTSQRMTVFRLAVYLKEDVVAEILQMALNHTIKRFPSFATDIKNGVFWHYFESKKRAYRVEEENSLPCESIKVYSKGNQLFRVMYYKNRISIELFHVLTDGTGGMLFLKALINEYIRLLGHSVSYSDSVLDINEAPLKEDSINKYEHTKYEGKAAGFKNSSALQFSGSVEKSKPTRVIHIYMNCNDLKKAVKSRKVTVTSFILSLILLSGKRDQTPDSGDYNIQVPVNLRQYYPSTTQRNFVLYCQIRMAANTITSIDDILPDISKQLKDKTSLDHMSAMILSTRKMVENLYYVPLILKNYGGRFGYSYLGDRGFSAIFSNLGVVKLPAELDNHIENFEFMLGPGISNRNECAMVTYGNTSVLSITKITNDTSFEDRMTDLLKRENVSFTVKGSENYGSKNYLSEN